MAQLITDFYEEKADCPDRSTEQQILNIMSQGSGLEELSPEEVTYPLLYHLSRERENILCWYPFREGADILEVGAECGAVTGLLCEKAHQVVCQEPSLERCRVNYERNKAYKNLQIFAGPLERIEFSQNFDYIVLREGAEAIPSLLPFLKEHGKLLIAAPNRLGLKYFAGTPETHTGIIGLGLRGYREHSGERAYSRQEWKERLKDSGLTEIRFYYPYPDEVFPSEIFTDATLSRNGYGKEYYNYVENRLEVFSEFLAAQDLAKEGIAGGLANAFLIEASRAGERKEKAVRYVKMNRDRAAEFQIYTAIEEQDGIRTVYKKALTEAAKEHLKQMTRREQQLKDGACACLCGSWDGEGIRYPFLQGGSLDETIAEAVLRESRDAIVKTVKTMFAQAFLQKQECGEALYTDRFRQVFGQERLAGSVRCVRPANIDLICGNVFREADSYKVIDCEWMFDFWIPEAFIVFRALNELYDTHAGLEAVIGREQLYREFGIAESQIPVFLSWNRHFTLEYVKANQMRRFARDKQVVDLNGMLWHDRTIVAGLYADYGEGFTEQDKQFLEQKLERGKFSLVYELKGKEPPRALRFDPVEGRVCRCRAFLVTEGRRIRLEPLNASDSREDWDEFALADPQYKVDAALVRGDRVQIDGEISYYKEQEALQRLENSRADVQQELDRLRYEYGRLQTENHMLGEQLEHIYATRVWRLREAARRIWLRIKGGRK